MAGDKFVYVTYIRTTQQTLFDALTKPEFTRQYWFGISMKSDWTVGASWQMNYPDGTVTDTGNVVEIDPPRRLVLRWRNAFKPELKAEGYSRASFTLEPLGETVKLTVLHEIDKTDSQFIKAVSNGWPMILSSLKSALETGKPLERPPS